MSSPLHRLCLGLTGLAISLPCAAQKENYNWYFGARAGITFHTSPPTSLDDGMMSTLEGSGAISDAEGNLLFYTDGISVFNRYHSPTLNGTNLGGDPSSTQCGVIQRKPGDKHLYYIFSIDGNGGRFSYSVVDMSLDDGLGDVIPTLKNIELAPSVTEKLVLIRKNSGGAYWVIAHEDQSDEFLIYELTNNGVSTVPTKIKTGRVHGGNRGYMRASADGSMLACAYSGPQKDLNSPGGNSIDLFAFDRKTGSLTFLKTFTQTNVYGLEFSPNGKYLYASPRGWGNIIQYDVSSFASVTVASSVPCSALQLGPDGKLYIAQPNTAYLGIIEYPDKYGTACGHKRNAIYLGRGCNDGLPGFTTRPIDFYYSDTCFGQFTSFNLDGIPEGKILWTFHDPAAGTDTSSAINTFHQFSKPGQFTVTLILSKDGLTDTLTKTVHIADAPTPLMQSKERICPGDSVLLDAENPGAVVQWNTGSAAHTIWAKTAGTYTVAMQMGPCTVWDTVIVEVKDTVSVSLGADKMYCADESRVLDAGPNADNYVWSTGDTTRSITVTKPGKYSVMKTLDGCVAYDTVAIGFHVRPAKLLTDTSLCEAFGDSIRLSANPGTNYVWSGISASGSTAIASKAGTYTVDYEYAAGCPVAETFHVRNVCPYRLYVPAAFHPGSDVETNRIFRPYGLHITRYEMKIYNRWGELLFTSQSVQDGWDGTFRDTLCQEGLYLYRIYYSAEDGARLANEFLSGLVMLLR